MKITIKQVLPALLMLAECTLHAQSPVINENFWHTDGFAYAVKHDEVNNVVYLGGDFDHFGPSEPHGASIDATIGAVDFSFANPDGTVWTAIADGNGGWYIGGTFRKVGHYD